MLNEAKEPAKTAEAAEAVEIAEAAELLAAVEPAEAAEPTEAGEPAETAEAAESTAIVKTASTADAPRRKPKITDPAYMKTEEEIDAQIAYLKDMSKKISIVLAIAIGLLLLGSLFLQ